MMTAEQLKASILQMAMQGKLVEQRAEEGTGEDLLKQVREEKQKLIRSGKIKKSKLCAAITEDEISFDIPSTWKRIRFEEAISLLSGADLTPDKYNAIEKGTVYLTGASNIENGSIIINRWTEFPKNIAHKGDLLLTCKGTVGKTAILDLEEVHIARQIMAITPILCDVKYIDFFLQYIVESLKKKAKSMIPGIERSTVLNALFPLPPLEEQKRIVAKIEELMPFVEQYAKASTKLNTLNASFPEQMKKSILQQAVMGKLVSQDPNDEPASVLLKKIAEEKQKLIKEGKIKKQKPFPSITEDEIPFEIPESWEWVQLGELCEVVTGRLDANAQDKNGKYPFFTCGEEVYTTKDYAFDCDAIQLGGNNAAGIYKMHRFAGKFNAYQRVYVISGRSKHEMDYIYCVIKFWLPSLRVSSQGTTTRFIKLGQVTEMLVPYPPVNEQKRIVEKLSQVISDLSQMRGKTSRTHPVYYPKGLMEL